MKSVHLKGRLHHTLLLSSLLLLFVSASWPAGSVARAASAPLPLNAGIVWVKEPLAQVFTEIQSKFIGVVPGNYTEPTPAAYSTMRSVFSLIESGISKGDSSSILSASALAQGIDYQLLPINDSATGHRFIVLVEGQDVNRGWGSYFFAAEQDRGPGPRVIVEAPHPVTDFNSQNIGYEIFTISYPSVFAFFVSGVERTLGPSGETDMAHKTFSIFETAIESFVRPGSVVIQIHSFDASRHPAYPMVVLSTGDGGTNGALESIDSSLLKSGISVGVFDGFNYEGLSATNNVQGRYVRSVWAGFVHAEVSTTVVFNSTLVSDFQGSLVRSILEGFRFPGYQIDPRIPAVTFAVVAIFAFSGLRLPKSGRGSQMKMVTATSALSGPSALLHHLEFPRADSLPPPLGSASRDKVPCS